jgi:RND family efflux transporter MFP subunit
MIGAAAFFSVQTIKKHSRESVNSNRNHAATPVIVLPVSRHEFRDEISAVGTLKAHETVLLSVKVAGNVEAILVDLSDRVEVGQVVVCLDRTNFELAVSKASAAFDATKSAASQAKIQLEHAQKEYHRSSNLLVKKVISQSHFDKAETAYKSARQALATAKDQVNQARAALQTARQYLKDTEIRSPRSGVVVDRNIEIGQSVAPGAPLLRILDQSKIKADIDLPESDFARIAIGMPAVIKVDAFPGKRFDGTVTRVNPMVDRQTRTFRIRIEAPNQTGKLVDGMFARVRLSAGQRMTLAVPRDALQRLPGSGTFYVFVVNKDKAVKRTIKTGLIQDQYAEVLDGLSEGQTIVISGAGRLRTGTKVIIK